MSSVYDVCILFTNIRFNIVVHSDTWRLAAAAAAVVLSLIYLIFALSNSIHELRRLHNPRLSNLSAMLLLPLLLLHLLLAFK